MNSLIQELTTELKSNTQIKDSIVVKVVLESINNSVLLGVSSSDVLENALSTLDQLAQATVNENLKEVVAKFKKMAVKPTQRLQNMAKEAGISIKIKALKESAMYGDPTFKYTISKIEEKLAGIPEFRLIGVISEALTPYSYDKNVADTISELAKYVNENRAKLEVINAIFEMRQTSSMIYSESIAELENSLLENSYSSDTLKMKMRGKSTLPIVNRLINTLSMVESKLSGKFNIGLGNGDAKVNSIIAPFCKISESEAVVFVDIDVAALVTTAEKQKIVYKEVSKFPAVQRDLALVVDRSVTYAAIEFAVGTVKLPKLKNIRLFDVFESDKLGVNKKSMALSCTFVDEEKTMTDTETDSMVAKLIGAFEKELGAEIRK